MPAHNSPAFIRKLLVFILLAVIFLSSISEVSFAEDESHWIHTSSYLEILLTEKVTSPFWGEHYWTLTQPPMARYLIGIGRLVGGYNRNELNTPWQFDHDPAWNVEHGNLPSPDLLWWSRLPMAILGALSGWILWRLIRKAAGQLAGEVFLFVFILNPYYQTHLRRAMSESPLLFYTVLATAVSIKALAATRAAFQKKGTTLRDLRPACGWFMLAGGCCGLAGASKINGLLSAAGLALLIITAGVLLQGPAAPTLRRTFVIRSAVLAVFSALLVFIALNPYLYPNLLVNMARMAKFRVQEMAIQVAGFPDSVLHDPAERIQVMSRRIFENYAWPNFHGARWVNLGLTILGLGGLLWKPVHSRLDSTASVAASLLFIPAPVALAALATPLDWDRYYLFPVVMATCLSSSGFSMAASWVYRKLARQFLK